MGIWRGNDGGIECKKDIGTRKAENICFFGVGASVWTESVRDHEDVKVCLELSQVPDSATEIRVEMVQVEMAQTVVGDRKTLRVLPLLFREVGRGSRESQGECVWSLWGSSQGSHRPQPERGSE